MAGILDRLVYEIGYEIDKTSFDQAQRGLKDIGTGFLSLSRMAIGAGSALFGFTALISSETAEIHRLANAMGVSMDATDAFGNEMKKIGGTAENFLDLIEETNNKIGEMKGLGELTTLEESLEILGMRFEDIRDLSPEEQFRAIAQSATELEDSQKAVTAVDMLMAGEANKLIASLRAQGLTYDDVIEKQKRLSLETDGSREGMLTFANSMNDFRRVTMSMAKFMIGTLAPTFDKIINQFVEWSSANKEIIASGLKEFINILSALFSGLWTVLRTLGNILSWVINMFGGLNSTIRILIGVGIAFGIYKVAQAIALIGVMAVKSGGAVALLTKGLKLMKNVLLVGALIVIFEDLYGWIKGTDSVMGDLVGTFDEWWISFQDGISVIGDLIVGLGNLIIESLLMPFNMVIDQLNNVIGLANSASDYLGMDGTFETIAKVTPADIGYNMNDDQKALSNYVGQTTSGLVDQASQAVSSTVSNAVNIVIDGSQDPKVVAQAVRVEMDNISAQSIQSQQPKQK